MSLITDESVLPTRQRSAKRAEMLADVITTALEGGVGYWSQASVYRWWSPTLEGGSAVHRDGEANAYAVLHEIEGGAEHPCTECDGTGTISPVEEGREDGDCEACYGTGGAPLLVTVEKVAEAIQRILDPEGGIRLASDYVGRIAIANRDPEEADLDAGDCDAIVQVAVLGEVVYG